MPRPRKPVEMLTASGAFRPDRHARRAAAPKSELPIGEPPPSLAPAEAACWREFVANCPAEVLTSGDRWALEAACRLMAKSGPLACCRPVRALQRPNPGVSLAMGSGCCGLRPS
jgi:hypothetical protein